MTQPTAAAFARPLSEITNENGNQICSEDQAGLTKREYFAAAALQGFIAQETPDWVGDNVGRAMSAVKVADALIEALNAKQKSTT